MKTKNIAALMIGRGGSTLKDKNILPVFGQPLLHYAAAAARRSKYIKRFYISSDCERILAAGAQAGYTKIERPSELSLPNSQSVDVVNHAMTIIEGDGPVDVLVVQHANVGTITERIVDDCIELLLGDPTLSSVVPSHEKAEYHPYRARKVLDDGTIEPFFDFKRMPVSGNRQDLPKCLFFDHSIWVLDVAKGIRSKCGQPPWSCMGDRIMPYITHDCFDVHDLEDLKRTEEWILRHGVPLPDFKSAS